MSKSRDDKEIERIVNRGLQKKKPVEDLAYWKGRLEDAKHDYEIEPTPNSAEELALCDRMVRKIEFYVLRK